jgi:hypothetical protein
MWAWILLGLAALACGAATSEPARGQKPSRRLRPWPVPVPAAPPPLEPKSFLEPRRHFEARRNAWQKLFNARQAAIAENERRAAIREYRSRRVDELLKQRAFRRRMRVREADEKSQAEYLRSQAEKARRAEEEKRAEEAQLERERERREQEGARLRKAAEERRVKERHQARQEEYDQRYRRLLLLFERQPHLASREYAERLARRDRRRLLATAERIEQEAYLFYADSGWISYLKQKEPRRWPEIQNFRDRELIALGIARDLDAERPKPKLTPEEWRARWLRRQREALQDQIAKAQLEEETAQIRQRLKQEALAKMRRYFDSLEGLSPDERDRLEANYQVDLETIYGGNDETQNAQFIS